MDYFCLAFHCVHHQNCPCAQSKSSHRLSRSLPFWQLSKPSKMAASKRVQNAKSDKFHKNINRRGQVPESTQKPKTSMPVGPVMLGFFIFVVVGSALLQIIRTATSGNPMMG